MPDSLVASSSGGRGKTCETTLTEFRAIVAGYAARGIRLRVLDLSMQKLRALSRDPSAEAAAPCSELDCVREINLGANYISSVEPNALCMFGNLTTINLSANGLKEFPDLGTMPALTDLYLSSNRIARLPDDSPLARLPALRLLDMRQSGLHTLGEHAFDSNTQLASLSLASNSLARIPTLPILPRLTFLSLSNNSLSLDADALAALAANTPRLTALSLADNGVALSHESAVRLTEPLWPELRRLDGLLLRRGDS